ncbi:hypothetical protein MYW52_25625 [Pseudomonas juntendi]|uniref:hypothetical protein n=1 Tax=Pseudomonas juntendi TaxID=2666183 RepID=UPI001FFD99CC|nr:hypothetical protein [Pseudomonas juntendi]MCK2118858.1 hypothetical protein [Pseudomonas juntendi]
MEDVLTELSGSTALHLTLSDTDQPLSIVIEERGRAPETQRLDGYLDLAVLLSFQHAYKQDRYEHAHPDYYAAALRAKSEQEFRDIYFEIKREAWLLDVRFVIFDTFVDLQDFRLVGHNLDVVSNMLFGNFERASELAFFPGDDLVARCRLFEINLEVYAMQVYESLVPTIKRMIKFQCPAVFTLLRYCESQAEFKSLCGGDLGFLRPRMDKFSDQEMETALAMELGL